MRAEINCVKFFGQNFKLAIKLMDSDYRTAVNIFLYSGI